MQQVVYDHFLKLDLGIQFSSFLSTAGTTHPPSFLFMGQREQIQLGECWGLPSRDLPHAKLCPSHDIGLVDDFVTLPAPS